MPNKENTISETAELQNDDSMHIKISVRDLVAFSVKDDAKWSFSSYRLAYEGSLAHSKIQAMNREEGNYTSEVTLSTSAEALGFVVEISGRADGIWRFDDKTIVHEIKTCTTPLSEIHEGYSDSHWAQGKCYAFMLSEIDDLEKVTVRLTYYNRDTEEQKSFDRVFSREKLNRFFKTLIYPYASWALAQQNWKQIRNSSIESISFPYPAYRSGQKLLAYNVYKSIDDSKRLFAQAPTGIGKTMGVLYPAIKSLGQGKLDRLFYATAKTTTRRIAENAYKLLNEQGLRLKVITLTAKDKICLNDVKDCKPDKCPYILGYMSRSRKVVKELLKGQDFFPREEITRAGHRYGICPFELGLDLSLSCDLIICDYNYIFDPRVYLRRFFEQKGREKYLILADEAHNLFDRAQQMFSSEIKVRELLDVSKEIKEDLPQIRKRILKLRRALSSIEKESGGLSYEAGGIKYNSFKNPPLSLIEPLKEFISEAEDWISGEREDKPYSDILVNLFFDILHFINILELYSDNYRTLITGAKTNLRLKLLCLDPSFMLNKTMNAARSAVLFSATLSPLWYFKSILGGRHEDITLRLPSPFPKENLLLYNENRIETRFRYRSKYLEATAKAIYNWCIAHKGNVMVFFPSYKYLLDVLEIFKNLDCSFEIMCQDRDMDEASRDEFLKCFDVYGDVNRVAFCVMGGVFSEGIDLAGDKLTGVIIVGVGLPQVSPELEIMREFYHGQKGDGFSYAYVYPGINKVLQAAGRLIRTETDKGALLLIDSRFASGEYLKLLPDEWHPIPKSGSGKDLAETVREFWEACE